ncbi:hypothetical protein [Glutamicibacter protophormiae]|uniref:hypothetical protein n=1 Tax=Glutamicibacter protophormiae TaxID=37930 RepID=UPI00195B3EB2|nr:hypothetical protein [Glutamicibacter protophormiae]QRQ79159.1 hypothetical protein JQN66_02580 [Glutamicibacter protophormiae]
MNFTSRTYRAAIKRSIRWESYYRMMANRSNNMSLWIAYHNRRFTQIAHTRQLQARKRKERK